MTTAPVDEPASRRLFICYRREDSGPYAGWLRESLVPTFGRERIFMDIDSIAPGAEFESVIRTTLAETDVVLVLIGPQWLSARDATGARRIDLHNDVLRREIAMAIECKRTMIPVLVGGARLPDSEMLPPEVQDLLRHQAVELTDSRWSYDTARLVKAITTVPRPKPDRASGEDVATTRVPEERHVQARMWRTAASGGVWFAVAAFALNSSQLERTLLAVVASGLNGLFIRQLRSKITDRAHLALWCAGIVAAPAVWWVLGFYFGEEGLWTAALISGLLTTSVHALPLNEKPLSTSHRAWRSTVGACVTFAAALLGYFSYSTAELSLLSVICTAGSVAGGLNGLLIALRMSPTSRIAMAAAGSAVGGVVWGVTGLLPDDPFVVAPLVTGFASAVLLINPVGPFTFSALGATTRTMLACVGVVATAVGTQVVWDAVSLEQERAVMLIGGGVAGMVVAALFVVQRSLRGPTIASIAALAPVVCATGWAVVDASVEGSGTFYLAIATCGLVVSLHKLLERQSR